MSYEMHYTARAITVLAALALLAPATQGSSAPRTCHSCQGINCQRTTLQGTQQCLDPLDYCVTIFEKFNVVQKGCSLEVPIELRTRCDANSAECHKCNTDRCNELGQVNFSCLQCNASEQVDCATDPAAIMPTRCASPTAPNSYCYVKYENNVLSRGCATTVAAQQSCYADSSCLLCLPGDIRACNKVDFTPGTRAMQF